MGTAKISSSGKKKVVKPIKKELSKTAIKKSSSEIKTSKKVLDDVAEPLKYNFKKVLQQIVKDYDGIDIFSEENSARLSKALLHIGEKFSKEREILIEANNCDVVQKLYAVCNNPQADKQNALESAKKELLAKDVEGNACKELLSSFSLILFKTDFLALENKKLASKKKKESFRVPSAYIAKISHLEPIPNADYVELATVNRKKVVVEKDQYSVGDLVVYVKPETYVKRSLKFFQFLKINDYCVHKRLIRGVVSEGIVVKPEDLSITEYSLGDDVSKIVVNSRAMASEKKRLEEVTLEEDCPVDNQDIRHWKEKKFYKNVYSSKQFKEADFETKKEMRRMAKKEAKMIKSLRRDAGLGGGCYITTAICEASGKADNCYELTVLRKFRDEWLAKQPDGMYLINDYYETAPKIVSAINMRHDRNFIYSFLESNFLKKCLSFIKKSQMMDCKKCYMDMVLYCYKFLTNKVSK